MSDFDAVLPLFPLAVAPVPGEVVPLRIFEQRYHALLEHCYDFENDCPKEPFGICYCQDEQLALFGCEMIFTRILGRNEEEGYVEVVAQAGARFELRKLLEPCPYPIGQVNYLRNFNDQPSQNLLHEVLSAVHLLTEKKPADLESLATAGEMISYRTAIRLKLGIRERLELVASNSESKRLSTLLSHTQSMLALQRDMAIGESALN